MYVEWNQGCYRFKNLVYLRTNKCAGTYFSNLFLQNGWREIKEYDIKENDLVIGFIQNPGTRRIKAVAQKIITSQAIHLLSDPAFNRFLSDSVISDEHNIPYFIQFRNRKNLTLIPLDYSTRAEVLLQNFCKIQDISIDLKIYNTENVDGNFAGVDKIKIYNHLKKYLNNSLFETIFKRDYNLHSQIMQQLDNDVELYLQNGKNRQPFFSTSNRSGENF